MQFCATPAETVPLRPVAAIASDHAASQILGPLFGRQPVGSAPHSRSGLVAIRLLRIVDLLLGRRWRRLLHVANKVLACGAFVNRRLIVQMSRLRSVILNSQRSAFEQAQFFRVATLQFLFESRQGVPHHLGSAVRFSQSRCASVSAVDKQKNCLVMGGSVG